MSVLNKVASHSYCFIKGSTSGYTNCNEATSCNQVIVDDWVEFKNYKRDDGNFEINRSVLEFDTSDVPATAVISSVLLYYYSKQEKDFTEWCGMYVCPVSATGNNVAYYNKTYFGTQIGHLNSLAVGRQEVNPNAWRSVSIGVAGIVKAGTTLLGLRQTLDYAVSAPWENGQIDEMYSEGFSSSGGIYKPYLVITYTTPPTVTTGSATNKGVTTVTLGGNVTDAGGGTVAERGIVYGLTENPTVANGKKVVAGTTGAYTGDITDLASATRYHYRAYVITENSTQYGADATFTTLPACETDPMTNLGVGSATANGEVTSVGSEITERGFVWDTATAPTTSDNKVVVAGTTGVMSSFITAMPIGRRVYLRAFATNETDTVYGNEIDFIMVGGVAMFSPL